MYVVFKDFVFTMYIYFYMVFKRNNSILWRAKIVAYVIKFSTCFLEINNVNKRDITLTIILCLKQVLSLEVQEQPLYSK